MKKKLIWIAASIIVVAAWTLFDLKTKPANDRIEAGTKDMVQKHPELKPMYEKAMSDGKLTILEAKAIVDEGKKLEE